MFPKEVIDIGSSSTISGGNTIDAYSDPARAERIKQASIQARFTLGNAPGTGNNCFIQSLLQGIHHANGTSASDPLKAHEEAAQWEAILRDEAVVNGFERTGYLGVSDLTAGTPDSKFRDQLVKNLDNYVLKIWRYNDQSERLENIDIVKGVKIRENETSIEINMLFDNEHFDPLFKNNSSENQITLTENSSLNNADNKFSEELITIGNSRVKRTDNIDRKQYGNRRKSSAESKLTFEELETVLKKLDKLDIRKEFPAEVVNVLDEYFQNGIASASKLNAQEDENRIAFILTKLWNIEGQITKEINMLEGAEGIEISKEIAEYFKNQTNENIGKNISEDNASLDILRYHFLDIQEKMRIKIFKAIYRNNYESMNIEKEKIIKECEINEFKSGAEYSNLKDLEKHISKLASSTVKEEISPELVHDLENYAKRSSFVENVKNKEAFLEELKVINQQLIRIATSDFWQQAYFSYKDQLEERIATNSKHNEKIAIINKIREKINSEINQLKKQIHQEKSPDILDEINQIVKNLSASKPIAKMSEDIKERLFDYLENGSSPANISVYNEGYKSCRIFDEELKADWKTRIAILEDIRKNLDEYSKVNIVKMKECDEKIESLKKLSNVKDVDEMIINEFRNSNPTKKVSIENLVTYYKIMKKSLKSELELATFMLNFVNNEIKEFQQYQENLEIELACDDADFTRGISIGTNMDCFVDAIGQALSNARGLSGSEAYANTQRWISIMRDAAGKAGMRRHQSFDANIVSQVPHTLSTDDLQEIYNGAFDFQVNSIFTVKLKAMLDKYVLKMWKMNSSSGKLEIIGEVRGVNAGKNGERPISINILLEPLHAEPLYPKDKGRIDNAMVIGYGDIVTDIVPEIPNENNSKNEFAVILDDLDNGSNKDEEYNKINDLEDQINGLVEWETGNKYVEAKNKLVSYKENGILSDDIHNKNKKAIDKILLKYTIVTNIIASQKNICAQRKEKYSNSTNITFNNEENLSKEFRQEFKKYPEIIEELKKFIQDRENDNVKLLEEIEEKVNSEIAICKDAYQSENKRSFFNTIKQGFKEFLKKALLAFNKALSLFTKNNDNVNTKHSELEKRFESINRGEGQHTVNSDPARAGDLTSELRFAKLKTVLENLDKLDISKAFSPEVENELDEYFQNGLKTATEINSQEDQEKLTFIYEKLSNYVALLKKEIEMFYSNTLKSTADDRGMEDKIAKYYKNQINENIGKNIIEDFASIDILKTHFQRMLEDKEMKINKALYRNAYEMEMIRKEMIINECENNASNNNEEYSNINELKKLISKLAGLSVKEEISPHLVQTLKQLTEKGSFSENVKDKEAYLNELKVIKKQLLSIANINYWQYMYFNYKDELSERVTTNSRLNEKIAIIENSREKINREIDQIEQQVHQEEFIGILNKVNDMVKDISISKPIGELNNDLLNYIENGSCPANIADYRNYYDYTRFLDKELRADWKTGVTILENIRQKLVEYSNVIIEKMKESNEKIKILNNLAEEKGANEKIIEEYRNSNLIQNLVDFHISEKKNLKSELRRDVKILKRVNKELKEFETNQKILEIEQACSKAGFKRGLVPGRNDNCFLESIGQLLSNTQGMSGSEAYANREKLVSNLRDAAVSIGIGKYQGFQPDILVKVPSRHSPDYLQKTYNADLDFQTHSIFAVKLKAVLDKYVLTMWKLNSGSGKLEKSGEVKGVNAGKNGERPISIDVLITPSHAEPLYPMDQERIVANEIVILDQDIDKNEVPEILNQNISERKSEAILDDIDNELDKEKEYRKINDLEYQIIDLVDWDAGDDKYIEAKNKLESYIENGILSEDINQKNIETVEKIILLYVNVAEIIAFEKYGYINDQENETLKLLERIEEKVKSEIAICNGAYKKTESKRSVFNTMIQGFKKIREKISLVFTKSSSVFPENSSTENSNDTRGGTPASAYSDAARLEAIKQASRKLGFTRGNAPGTGNNCFIQSLLQGIHNVNGTKVNDPKKAHEEAAVWETILRDIAVEDGFERTGHLGVSDLTHGQPDSKLRAQVIENLDNYILKIYRYNEKTTTVELADVLKGINAEKSGIPIEINILYDRSHFDPLFKNNTNKNTNGKSTKDKPSGKNETANFEGLVQLVLDMRNLKDWTTKASPEMIENAENYFRNGIRNTGKNNTEAFEIYEKLIDELTENYNEIYYKINVYEDVTRYNDDDFKNGVIEHYCQYNPDGQAQLKSIPIKNVDIHKIVNELLDNLEQKGAAVKKVLSRVEYEYSIIKSQEISEMYARGNATAKLSNLETIIQNFAKLEVGDKVPTEILDRLKDLKIGSKENVKWEDAVKNYEDKKLILLLLAENYKEQLKYYETSDNPDDIELIAVKYEGYIEKLNNIEIIRKKLNSELAIFKRMSPQENAFVEMKNAASKLLSARGTGDLEVKEFEFLDHYLTNGIVSSEDINSHKYYKATQSLDEAKYAEWERKIKILDDIRSKLLRSNMGDGNIKYIITLLLDKINSDIEKFKAFQVDVEMEEACAKHGLKLGITPGNNNNCMLESITKTINRANGNHEENPRKAYKEAALWQSILRQEVVKLGIRYRGGIAVKGEDPVTSSPYDLKIIENANRVKQMSNNFRQQLRLNLDNYILTQWKYDYQKKELIRVEEIRGVKAGVKGVESVRINFLANLGHADPLFPGENKFTGQTKNAGPSNGVNTNSNNQIRNIQKSNNMQNQLTMNESSENYSEVDFKSLSSKIYKKFKSTSLSVFRRNSTNEKIDNKRGGARYLNIQ